MNNHNKISHLESEILYDEELMALDRLKKAKSVEAEDIITERLLQQKRGQKSC